MSAITVGSSSEGYSVERLIGLGAAWLSLAAAAIHFAVLGAHYNESWMYGVFFAVVAWFQAGWALLVVHRPARWLYWAGAAGNAAVIVVWAVTRTAGVPVGPASGETEDVAFVDMLATSTEALIVVACIAVLLGRQWMERGPVRSALWAVVVLALAVMPLTSAALVDEAQGAASGHGEANEHSAVAELGSADLGDLHVSGAFVRTAPAGDVSAAYLRVRNRGGTADALVEASTDVASSARLHETVTQGSSGSMPPVNRIDVPAGGEAVLETDGYHIMLMDLTRDLREGERISLRLRFERAGTVSITVPVLPYTFELPTSAEHEGSDHAAIERPQS